MALTKKISESSDLSLIYVTKFEWKNSQMQAYFHPHPIVGRVYVAIHHRPSGSLMVSLRQEAGNGGVVGGLVIPINGVDWIDWTCEVVELDNDNILTLDICAEDFHKIQWFKDTNTEQILESQFGIKKNDDNSREANKAIHENPSEDCGSVQMLTQNKPGSAQPQPVAKKDTDEIKQSVQQIMDDWNSKCKQEAAEAVGLINDLLVTSPWVVSAVLKILKALKQDIEDGFKLPMFAAFDCIYTDPEIGQAANLGVLFKGLKKAMASSSEEGLVDAAVALVYEILRFEENDIKPDSHKG